MISLTFILYCSSYIPTLEEEEIRPSSEFIPYIHIRGEKLDTSFLARGSLALAQSSYLRKSFNLQVRVGDLVRVDRDQLFPADLLLLSSSEPQGTCYIETSNLDGETNLKVKQALPAAASLSSPHELVKCRMVIECEPPNRHVDEFSGNIDIHTGIDQLLLRGARLKNTAWIFGAVVYTGCDSKLLMNAKKAPLKNCTVDKKTNTRILFLFIILVTISVLSAIGSQLWLREHLPSHWYISFLGKERVTFLWQTLTFFILYNNLIPISLQVTMEIVRFFQANYINIDQEMYDKKSGSSSVARTSNLNEELGLVKYVMSDKTGTLTQNVMTFKQISVAGKIFGDSRLSEFSDERLLEEYKALPRTRNREDIGEILTMMAVCHTVVPEKADGKVTYQYSSPDEGALVRGAAAQGFVLNSRTPHYMVLSIFEEEKMFEILDVIDFTSERKRMSVILRDSSNRIKLYTKGADTVIMERLTCESDGAAELCEQHLEQFASHGYRTLCFAMRELEEEEYTEWSKGYHEAGVLITGRQEALAEEAEKIEIELRLVGATAIEDKLQEYVPETIRVLTAAGIRVWMLTGDKRETALNIAYSCELCDSTTEILFVDEDTFEDTYTRLVQLNCQSELFAKEGRNFVTVIDGKSLVHAMVGECRPYFGDLALRCRAVVCCRMCPMQKAEVVEMVQAVGNHIVLAVGDGANDVAMIQAANVGVGISGEEGLQAASASDYAIPRFHFLRRLLLIWSTFRFRLDSLHGNDTNLTERMASIPKDFEARQLEVNEDERLEVVENQKKVGNSKMN
ncbi:unnamed protein product [Heligmosomoides polygyrus]|uniref:Phospholipid-transporting ATPase n=1 Tax=Heligmosomoides polygyrus TaxID=6339 RepID=A0A3P8AZ87_HELPZ|nr:unnamed protein product [Heligmosomoides polygyrus]